MSLSLGSSEIAMPSEELDYDAQVDAACEILKRALELLRTAPACPQVSSAMLRVYDTLTGLKRSRRATSGNPAGVLIKTVRQVSAARKAEWALLDAAREQVSVLLELLSDRDAAISRKDLTIRSLRAELRGLQPVQARGAKEPSAA